MEKKKNRAKKKGERIRKVGEWWIKKVEFLMFCGIYEIGLFYFIFVKIKNNFFIFIFGKKMNLLYLYLDIK